MGVEGGVAVGVASCEEGEDGEVGEDRALSTHLCSSAAAECIKRDHVSVT